MQAKQKDNMSREMKQRLRQEYYGLGGAENKVGSCAVTSAVLAGAGVLGWGDKGFGIIGRLTKCRVLGC